MPLFTVCSPPDQLREEGGSEAFADLPAIDTEGFIVDEEEEEGSDLEEEREGDGGQGSSHKRVRHLSASAHFVSHAHHHNIPAASTPSKIL